MVNFVFLISIAYLLGSIPFGKLMGFRHGIDIQKHGSGNIGFANSLRILGLKPALIVLAGDILKGFLPVVLALRILPLNETLWISLTAILAHIFPVWLKFKGGKGIATALGVTLALNPYLGLVGAFIWIVVLTIIKLNSLASLIVIYSMPITAYFLSRELTVFYVILLMVGTWTHRQNIYRLIKGTEKGIIK